MDNANESVILFEDINKKFDLTIWIGNKRSTLTITEQQAEKIKSDLGIEINYIPF